MSSNLSPVTKSKSVIITTGLSVFFLLYKAVDAAGNTEFLLQKLGINEDVSRALGSSRVIDVMVTLSLLSLVVALVYQVNRYASFHGGPISRGKNLTAPLAIDERENSLSAPEYKYSNDWLQNLAERDKRKIDLALLVYDCSSKWNLDSGTPYVAFTFTVFNGSVYAVSIDPKIEGFISYGNQRLEKEITLSKNWNTENLMPRKAWNIEIQQWLTREEAEVFQKEVITQIHQAHFSFEQLRIKIVGGDDFKDVAPKYSRFAHFRGISLDRRLL